MERLPNKKPAVRCLDCEREWFGDTAADGLVKLGGCPRCGGPLEFLRAPVPHEPHVNGTLPHLALGTPRLY